MKILIPHPQIKPHHVKHAAAGTTIFAGFSDMALPYHIGAVLFVIAGCIAIYEPYLVHEVELSYDPTDGDTI